MSEPSSLQPDNTPVICEIPGMGIPAHEFFELCDFLKALTLDKLNDTNTLFQLACMSAGKPTFSSHYGGNTVSVYSDAPNDYLSVIAHFTACIDTDKVKDTIFAKCIHMGGDVIPEFANEEDRKNFFYLQISIPFCTMSDGIKRKINFIMVPCEFPPITMTNVHICGTPFQMIGRTEDGKSMSLVITDKVIDSTAVKQQLFTASVRGNQYCIKHYLPHEKNFPVVHTVTGIAHLFSGLELANMGDRSTLSLMAQYSIREPELYLTDKTHHASRVPNIIPMIQEAHADFMQMIDLHKEENPTQEFFILKIINIGGGIHFSGTEMADLSQFWRMQFSIPIYPIDDHTYCHASLIFIPCLGIPPLEDPQFKHNTRSHQIETECSISEEQQFRHAIGDVFCLKALENGDLNILVRNERRKDSSC